MSSLSRSLLRWAAPLWLAAGLLPLALAAGEGPAASAPADARGWLARIHAAANSRNYQGVMVFTTDGASSSSRVAHFCVGDQVYERIEALDGKKRQVYRHNDKVHTLWPQSGLAVVETRTLQSSLPSATQSVEPRALEQYDLRHEGQGRVADREAVIFLLQPRDGLRFAQRLWADQETGLMLRSDVIGPSKAVLESAFFSEVEIGVRAQPESVTRPIGNLEAYRVLRPAQQATQLEAEGWTLSKAVPGFRMTSCVKRPANLKAVIDGTSARSEVTQAVFSDGLTHVSLFIEPFDAARHRSSIQAQFGATHSLSGRKGEFWVTAMGDVPPTTLKQFIDSLERRP